MYHRKNRVCHLDSVYPVFFSRLDLKNVYLQIPLHGDCRDSIGINTHFGLYFYKVLLFEFTVSSVIFRSMMNLVIQDLVGIES